MTQVLLALIAFVLVITLLVTLHEFGHFIAAKFFGVKILRASIGFGPKLFGIKDKRGTEYAISLIPLGGYLKMLDENNETVAPHEKHLAFNRKHPLKKMVIVLAGPLFNFLFALLFLWITVIIGTQHLSPLIGEVKPNSIASKAQLKKNYRIIAVNHQPTKHWQDVKNNLIDSWINHKNIILTVEQPDTHQKSSHTLHLNRLKQNVPESTLLDSLGLSPAIPSPEPVIHTIEKNSPAALAGIRKHDRVLKVNKQPVKDFAHLTQLLAINANKIVHLHIARQGKIIDIAVVPKETRITPSKKVGRIGVRSRPIKWPKNLIYTERHSVWKAFPIALHQTASMTHLSVKLMGEIVTGRVSWHYISGPIGIAKSAGLSLQHGISTFLKLLAIVSISFGLINLLPIPLLDGGHFIYHVIELIIRRPLPKRFQILSFKIGFLLLLGLMMLALINDCMRL